MNGTKAFEKAIEAIINDRTSGSSQLEVQTQDALEAALKAGYKPESLIPSLQQLVKACSSFVVLIHFVNAYMKKIEDEPEINPKTLMEWIKDWKTYRKASHVSMAHWYYTELGKSASSLLLHSNSGALQDLVKNQPLDLKQLTIYQTTSRPGNEGIQQAKVLADAGFFVHLIEDVAVEQFMDQIDHFVTGADSLWPDGWINKIGTGLMARAFQAHGKPVVVLADSHKFVSPEWPESLQNAIAHEQSKDPSELTTESHPNITIHNAYFEKIPDSQATYFVTERGVFSPTTLHHLDSKTPLAANLLSCF